MPVWPFTSGDSAADDLEISRVVLVGVKSIQKLRLPPKELTRCSFQVSLIGSGSRCCSPTLIKIVFTKC
jgi:hypothetical protein